MFLFSRCGGCTRLARLPLHCVLLGLVSFNAQKRYNLASDQTSFSSSSCTHKYFCKREHKKKAFEYSETESPESSDERTSLLVSWFGRLSLEFTSTLHGRRRRRRRRRATTTTNNHGVVTGCQSAGVASTPGVTDPPHRRGRRAPLPRGDSVSQK